MDHELPGMKFPFQGKTLEYMEVIAHFFDHEDNFIHGRNPRLPREILIKANGEILMKEDSYRVGGVAYFPVQVLT